jgi:hypothetical protein
MAPVHQALVLLAQTLEHALLEELLMIPSVQALEPVLVVALLGPAAQKPRA